MERAKDVGGTILAWVMVIVVGGIILMLILSNAMSNASQGPSSTYSDSDRGEQDRAWEAQSEQQEVGR